MRSFPLFLLIVIALSLTISAPTTTAHDCTGSTPEQTCGPCTDREAHNHTWSDRGYGVPESRIYCHSPGEPLLRTPLPGPLILAALAAGLATHIRT